MVPLISAMIFSMIVSAEVWVISKASELLTTELSAADDEIPVSTSDLAPSMAMQPMSALTGLSGLSGAGPSALRSLS